MQIEASRWKQKQVSVQSSLSTNIYCDKLKQNSNLNIFPEYFRGPLKRLWRPPGPLFAHPCTRLIHTSLRCWTIYRFFEIILEMGTVHWSGLQIQCSIEIHCFKKHSV